MAQSLPNRNRLLEKYIQVVREDGLNTNKNVNVGLNGTSAALWVSGNITSGGSINGTMPVITASTATLTLTAAQSGSVVLLTRAAGTTVTLPAPAPGIWFTFLVTVATSGGSQKIITPTIASQFILGQANVYVGSTGAAKYFVSDGSTDVSINLNGTTTGGAGGDKIVLIGSSSTIYTVDSDLQGSGTVATPFATS